MMRRMSGRKGERETARARERRVKRTNGHKTRMKRRRFMPVFMFSLTLP